jgi:ATP-dependent protease ClpP protease subunit
MSQKVEIYKDWIQAGGILINEKITPNLAARVVLDLKLCKRNDNIKIVNMYINSAGGDTSSMQMIIAEMERVAAIKKIQTHILNYAYSAAAIIALFGTIRTADRFATILFHDVRLTSTESTVHDINWNQKQLNDLNKFSKEVIKQKTKMTMKQINTYFDNKDIFISAQQALRLNIINKII